MPSDKPPDSARESGFEYAIRRRSLLKTAGIGVLGASTLTSDTVAAADGPYSERVKLGPFKARTVDISKLAESDPPKLQGLQGSQGSAEELEMRARTPANSSSDQTGKGGEVLSSNNNVLDIRKDFDGLTTIDTARTRGDADGPFALAPADPNVAASEDYIVTSVNLEIAFVSKADAPSGGTRVPDNPDVGDEEYFSVYRIEDWFGNVLEEDFGVSDPVLTRNIFLSDPRVQYDEDDGVFMIVLLFATIEDSDPEGARFDIGTGAYLLSVSKSNDPNGKWYNYHIKPKQNTGIPDYPPLGYNRDAIYLSQNFFKQNKNLDFSFAGATFDVVDKNAVLKGSDLDPVYEFTKLTEPNGETAFGIQPADAHGASAGYAVSSQFPNGEIITIWEVTERQDGTPDLKNAVVEVPPYLNPRNTGGSPQPGTEDLIDLLFPRILDATYDPSDGSLWATHTVNDGSARWYKLDPSGPALLQKQTFKRSGEKTYFPAVGTNGKSTLLVYNTSSADDYVSVEVAGRRPNVESDELEDFAVVHEGEQTYDLNKEDESDKGPQVWRWGDYNAVSVDPSDDSYWVIAKYANRVSDRPTETEIWGTRIANVEFDS